MPQRRTLESFDSLLLLVIPCIVDALGVESLVWCPAAFWCVLGWKLSKLFVSYGSLDAANNATRHWLIVNMITWSWHDHLSFHRPSLLWYHIIHIGSDSQWYVKRHIARRVSSYYKEDINNWWCTFCVTVNVCNGICKLQYHNIKRHHLNYWCDLSTIYPRK